MPKVVTNVGVWSWAAAHARRLRPKAHGQPKAGKNMTATRAERERAKLEEERLELKEAIDELLASRDFLATAALEGKVWREAADVITMLYLHQQDVRMRRLQHASPTTDEEADAEEKPTYKHVRMRSKRPGSECCLRFVSPPRPSPGTWRRAWNLPFFTWMTFTKPVLL